MKDRRLEWKSNIKSKLDDLTNGNGDVKYEIIAILLVVMFFLFFRINIILSGSMYPSLQTGDIYVARRIFKNEKKDLNRFDIVIISEKGERAGLLKRVVGLPNETLSIRDGDLYIDDEEIEDDPGFGSNTIGDEFRQFSDTQIPENQAFIMGDNRDYSVDSRELGMFSLDDINYKVIKVFSLHKLKQNIELF